jgi:hypothetical protein
MTKSKQHDEDFTGKLGPLYRSEEVPEWPMYSFSRVAYEFWNGFANGLLDRGLTEDEVKDELQSKGVRWLLDQHGDNLESLGGGGRSPGIRSPTTATPPWSAGCP